MFNLEEKKSEDIYFHFNTKESLINTNTLGELLIAFSNSVRCLEQESNESPLEINVRALNEGSFELVIGFFTVYVEAVPFLNSLTDNIKSLFALYKFLKGTFPSKVQKLPNSEVEITSNYGEVKVFKECVFNVYSNNPQSPLGNVNKLTNDSNIESLELLNTEKELILNIKKDEFPYFIPHRKVVEKEKEKEEEVEAELTLHKLVLGDFSSNWEFVYREGKIKAKILDKSFQKKIEYGISFRRGDKLKALLKITKKFDQILDTYIIKKYEVIKVIDFYPRTIKEQPQFKL